MPKNKGTFNAGWWNCFYSFAGELLDTNRYADTICIRTLQAAGITTKEAEWQLEHGRCNDQKVMEVVRDYWLHYAN